MTTMRVDSHQHFWRYSAAEYPWMQPDWPIRRDFLPDDLAPELRACGLDGCVAVQARQSLEETRLLLGLADASPLIRGVVGWVDLCSPRVEEQLAEFAPHPKFVGVRHVVQDEPDDRFMLREDFQRGIGLLRGFELTYDILIYPRQLSAAIDLARAFPEQPFVLDHLAKPVIRKGTLSPWREQLRELAASPNVLCKVSGLVTEARWHQWQPADFRAYLDAAFEAFGPDRLLFGSDWPVALLAATYGQVFSLVRDYVGQLGDGVDAKFFGLNAARFYDLC
ncbi:MAG: L-fuconolactonase [Chthoniobacter sp.]|jgi:L-fuconolactonase|nr:L-fuconolactonase [Chthoniobacter sp.]